MLHVRAGNGGNGIVAFRREKYVPRGGPDGGDGGNGGNVVLQGDPNENSLHRLYHHPHQRAEHGGHGRGANRTGRTGRDTLLNVPLGTVVIDPDSGEIVTEILEEGQQAIIAKGGTGGLGNTHFKSSVTQAPQRCTPGTEGEERSWRLELKLVADVGLVGFPNAGKSTLLTALTDARPKIASYPFTTRHPLIGTMIDDQFNRLRIADVPGLVHGAAEGTGLGHYFLRHIERTRFLLVVLDMAATDGRDPADDYANLLRELQSYNPDLLRRPRRIVANKMDEPGAEDHLSSFREQTGENPIPISAGLGEGIEKLKEILYLHFFNR